MILAVDPGSTESAFVVVGEDCRPRLADKIPNRELLELLDRDLGDALAIEMVASYGMPVGAEVFETVYWVGRFAQRWNHRFADRDEAQLVYRRDIKLHHCGSVRANDANIAQALVDRFAPGEPNRGKGTKAAPGWFYGFHSDLWQAYALAVYVYDTQKDPTT